MRAEQRQLRIPNEESKEQVRILYPHRFCLPLHYFIPHVLTMRQLCASLVRALRAAPRINLPALPRPCCYG